jgi:hypothetical protein
VVAASLSSSGHETSISLALATLLLGAASGGASASPSGDRASAFAQEVALPASWRAAVSACSLRR